mgnify:CR=1 FL=1
MNKVKAAVKAAGMTTWFIKNSWSYVTTKRLSSKVEFVVGLLPAWCRFTYATYKDFKRYP